MQLPSPFAALIVCPVHSALDVLSFCTSRCSFVLAYTSGPTDEVLFDWFDRGSGRTLARQTAVDLAVCGLSTSLGNVRILQHAIVCSEEQKPGRQEAKSLCVRRFDSETNRLPRSCLESLGELL